MTKAEEADHVPRGYDAPREPFSVGCADMKKLYEPGKDEENRAALAAIGGGAGLAKMLGSDPLTGISGDAADLDARKHSFGVNRFPDPPFESWISLFLGCFHDEVLIILIVAAIVSVVIGSIPAVSDHPDTGWIDGFAIMLAVLIVATVTATNDYNKQLQFRALAAASKARIEVQVVRGGRMQTVGTTDVVVGDIVHLETGTKLPADGIVLRCNDFKTNESAITGESDDIKKDPLKAPIVLSGTQVAAGTADYIVTAVGTRSMQGSIMADATQEDGDTPLQVKLDALASKIGYVGMACAAGTFIAMMIIKATGATPEPWGVWTVKSFIYGVTIIVVAIPEGLPLAVTISLAYSTRQMLADQNLIRHLDACETMGGATDICSDKTGTLTENRMTVTQVWVGGSRVQFPDSEQAASPDASVNYPLVPGPLRELLRDQLALNSTAVVLVSNKGKREVKGSKTEGAGLLLVESFGFDPTTLRAHAAGTSGRATLGAVAAERVLKQFSFSSDRKMMSTIVQLPDGRVRMFTTGGSDFILARCTRVLQVDNAHSATPEAGCTALPLTPALADRIVADQIVDMARQSLRTLGVAYRDFPSVESLPANYMDDAPEAELTLYAILGIKDPLRKDVTEAVATCQAAGVMVRMVTGDNKITATAIAKECGILREGGLVMEGPDFRSLTPAQLDLVLPRLCVLARSSPKDKNVLVRRLNGNLPSNEEEWLKEHPGCDWATERDLLLPGHYDEWAAARTHPGRKTVYKAVVGVTGDGTNDAPALKAADVGLSMGISGTQVAMDASDIIILDDRFSSIVKAVMWGRSVYDNVQKFLQFQLTVNVVALALTFLAAVLQQEPPLNPIMMLWVNLIMDTMGALALGTEKPSPVLLSRLPYSATASLVLPRMWRHILVQAALQLGILLALVVHAEEGLGITEQFLADTGKYLHAPEAPTEEDVGIYRSTFIFNAFVWCQIFNEVNARSLTDNPNVYTTLARAPVFIVVILISGGFQAIMVELGGKFTKCSGLTGTHWGYSVGLGALALPLGVLMRALPVPGRPSDFASFYTTWFARSQAEKEAAHLEGGGVAIKATVVSSDDVGSASGVAVAVDETSKLMKPSLSLRTGDATVPPSPLAVSLNGPMSPNPTLANVEGLHTGYTPRAVAGDGSSTSAPA